MEIRGRKQEHRSEALLGVALDNAKGITGVWRITSDSRLEEARDSFQPCQLKRHSTCDSNELLFGDLKAAILPIKAPTRCSSAKCLALSTVRVSSTCTRQARSHSCRARVLRARFRARAGWAAIAAWSHLDIKDHESWSRLVWL